MTLEPMETSAPSDGEIQRLMRRVIDGKAAEIPVRWGRSRWAVGAVVANEVSAHPNAINDPSTLEDAQTDNDLIWTGIVK